MANCISHIFYYNKKMLHTQNDQMMLPPLPSKELYCDISKLTNGIQFITLARLLEVYYKYVKIGATIMQATENVSRFDQFPEDETCNAEFTHHVHYDILKYLKA